MKIENDTIAVLETIEEAAVICQIDCSEDIVEWSEAFEFNVPETTVTRAQVLEAITPKEGDPVFYWGASDPDECNPIYDSITLSGTVERRTVTANALTLGKSVGQLRELLEWCKQ